MYLVNSQEMKQYDNSTISYYKIPSMVLMERAALSVFSEIKKRYERKDGRILVLCGVGNNGGDGFAVARLLHLAGYPVELFCPVNKEKMTPEAKNQYETAVRYHVTEITGLSETAYSIVVDALFGIGLSRPIEGRLAEIVKALNQTSAFKIAVDIASGISADTGNVLGIAFHADLTVTFGFAKVGQLLYPGAEYTGELITADIGIDTYTFCDRPEGACHTGMPGECSFFNQKPKGQCITKKDAAKLLPLRKAYSNKGSYGKALIVAGSPDMAGAAYFAAKAAYLSGCGLVRILTAEENRSILLTKLPEAILTTYSFCDRSEEASAKLKECIQWADAVLIGPGLGGSITAQHMTEEILQYKEKKIVFDADALNILSKQPNLFTELTENQVVTPHLGEMSRLLKCSVDEIQKNLIQTASDFAADHKMICVLKDARTVIAEPEGNFYINMTGNHGMATGGSGDVLAGFLTGFAAQGLNCRDAAALSVYLHGRAGDLATLEKGPYSMLASDLLDAIPSAIKELLCKVR